jgi:hypothetical protein
VRSAVISAYSPAAGVHWAAPGITSSTAAGNAAAGVGYGEGSAVLGLSGTQTASWGGETVDATSVLARYTLLGDATLDGAVDFNDLVKLAQNYNTASGVEAWGSGDFTYDGNVDFNDLVKLAQNYNQALPAGPVPGAAAGFGGDLAAAFAAAAVPEPGALSLVAVGAGALLGRRRRRGGSR